MAISDNNYNRPFVPPTIESGRSSSQRVNISITNPVGGGGTSGGGGGGVDQAAVNALINAAVYPWSKIGNLDPIPASKLLLAASADTLNLTDHAAIFTLPTVADTTLTATVANTQYVHNIPSLTGAGVTGFITSSVSSNVARLTFPKEGFISGGIDAFINVTSSTSGTSGSVGHFYLVASLFDSAGTLKVQYKWTDIIHDPVTSAYPDRANVDIHFTPVDAGDYMTFKLVFESSRAGQNIRFNLPAHSSTRREQIDIYFYEKTVAAPAQQPSGGGVDTAAVNTLIEAKVEDYAEVGQTATVTPARLPDATATVKGAVTLNTIDTRADGRVAPWARTGQNAPSSGTGTAADWAEAGNQDPIPPEKLKNVLEEANEVLELRPNSDTTVATTITLPADFATRYKYLAIGGSTGDPPTAWGEYGIIDLEYLNAFDTLAITSQVQPGRYTWTKSSRTITGRINGAYLYGFTDGRDYTEDGWIRDPGTTQIPTTASNDGIEGIDVPDNIVNKYPFFACSLWGPGTVTFLPNQFYKDIPEGQSRIFRVYDEANTSTLKVTNGSPDFEFDAHNQATNGGVNTMRDARFVKFGELENITPNAVVTTLQLPAGYKEKDFFIAVTKNPAHNYWTMWTIRTRINFETTRLSLTGRFNPGANIVYAALVRVNTELALQAEDVHVDVSNFNTLTGDNVQTALAELDVKAGEIVEVKEYAKSGNTTDKIPLSDYATTGTVAEIQAISAANLKANHLYIGT